MSVNPRKDAQRAGLLYVRKPNPLPPPNQQTQATPVAGGTIGSLGSLGSFGATPGDAGDIQMSIDPVQLAANAQAAQSANNTNFPDKDPADYHQLYNGRKYYADQNMDIDQQMATIAYLSDQPESGSLYSPSQNLNWALANGLSLTGQQRYMDDNLTSAMHNLGYNLTLTRYDHRDAIDGLLRQVGYTQGGYDTMSAAELRQALVGTTYTNNAYLSTSYNDFAKAGSQADTFTSRAVRIEYKAAANAQGFMPGRGPGGDFGEIVLGKNQQFKIVGVRYNRKRARAKGTQSYSLPQVVLVVEVGSK